MFCDFVRTIKEAEECPRYVQFDTDSFRIGIDMFSSGFTSPNKYHFITYKTAEGQECKGITVGMQIEGRGKLKLRIDNNDGVMHTITVPNYVHILELLMVLMFPQH